MAVAGRRFDVSTTCAVCLRIDRRSSFSGWDLKQQTKDEVDTAQANPCSLRSKHPSNTHVPSYLATCRRATHWKGERLDLVARCGNVLQTLLHFLRGAGRGKGRLSDYQLPEFPLIRVTAPPVLLSECSLLYMVASRITQFIWNNIPPHNTRLVKNVTGFNHPAFPNLHSS